MFPTLTREQLENFDLSLYDLAAKACTGVFSKFKDELTTGKELTKTLQQYLIVTKTKDETGTLSPNPVPLEHPKTSATKPDAVVFDLGDESESLLRPLQSAQSLLDLTKNKANEACFVLKNNPPRIDW